MSTPRWFKNIDDLLSAARDHGFITKKAHSGHWQVWDNREGFGPNRLLATFGGTGMAIHGVIAKTNVAKIKKATGIDIRMPPPPRPKPVEKEPVPIIWRQANPPPPPPNPTGTAEVKEEKPQLLRSEIERIVKQTIVDILQDFVDDLANEETEEEEVEQEEEEEIEQEAKPAPEPQPEPEVEAPKRKRRANLTSEEIQQIIALYHAGEPPKEIEEAFDLKGKGQLWAVLRRAGAQTLRDKGIETRGRYERKRA